MSILGTTAFWSDESRALLRPFRTFAAIADRKPEAGALIVFLRRPALLLLMLGAFVSFTSAGRLVGYSLLNTAVFWSFVPGLQVVAVCVVAAVLRSNCGIPVAVDRFFVGQGPWYAFFLAISGLCLFSPDVFAAFSFIMGKGILPIALLATAFWSNVVTVACFRAGFGFSRKRTLVAFGLYHLLYSGVIVSYYLAMDQLQPLMSAGGS